MSNGLGLLTAVSSSSGSFMDGELTFDRGMTAFSYNAHALIKSQGF
jgi:hypothetical protein